ncbi:MAG: hypothetical protein KAV83_01895 [Desulfobacterales bacterium]|nr:hypothetical protein [Desulfobacterales bacterium]
MIAPKWRVAMAMAGRHERARARDPPAIATYGIQLYMLSFLAMTGRWRAGREI